MQYFISHRAPFTTLNDPVEDLDALRLVPTTDLDDSSGIYVRASRALYFYVVDATDPDDDAFVVEPTGGVGRWVQEGYGLVLVPHTAQHQHGGGDEVATATSAPNAIPKAGSAGQLDPAWLGAGTPSDGAVLRQSGSTVGFGAIPESSVTNLEADLAARLQGNLGSTDNSLLRAEGTGGNTAQGTPGATLSDDLELTGVFYVHSVREIVASPDTQLASDEVLLFTPAAQIVNLLASCSTGREFDYRAVYTSTLTLQPDAGDTLDGGAAGVSKTFTLAAGNSVRLLRSAVGAWRSLLPGT